jgi:hypothetical protein
MHRCTWEQPGAVDPAPEDPHDPVASLASKVSGAKNAVMHVEQD